MKDKIAHGLKEDEEHRNEVQETEHHIKKKRLTPTQLRKLEKEKESH